MLLFASSEVLTDRVSSSSRGSHGIYGKRIWERLGYLGKDRGEGEWGGGFRGGQEVQEREDQGERGQEVQEGEE